MALAAALCALLSGCGKQDAASASEQVQAHWDTLQNAQFQAKILSDLGQSTLEYTLHFAYNQKGNDTFEILSPEVLAGITASIAGEDTAAMTLQYDGTALDAPGQSRAGLSPSDAIFYLLCDLRTASPAEAWTERDGGEALTVLTYVHEEDFGDTVRQIWLRDAIPVRAEIYAEGQRVLVCTFSSWTENE